MTLSTLLDSYFNSKDEWRTKKELLIKRTLELELEDYISRPESTPDLSAAIFPVTAVHACERRSYVQRWLDEEWRL